MTKQFIASRFLAYSLIYLLAQSLYAAEMPGFQFLLLRKSPRALAMGDAFAAVSDDHMAVWTNPAGIAYLKNTHFQAGATQLGTDEQDSQPVAMFSLSRPNSALTGAWALHASGYRNEVEQYDTLGNFVGSPPQTAATAHQENNAALGFTMAGKLGKSNSAIGVTGQFVNDSFPNHWASAVMGTIGLVLASGEDRFRFGVMGYNIGSAAEIQTTQTTQGGTNQGGTGSLGTIRPPNGVRLGAALRPFTNKALTLAFDLDRPSYASAKSAHFGLELNIADVLKLRGGVVRSERDPRVTAGVGLKAGRILLDAAVSSSQEQSGFGNLFTVSLGWWLSRDTPKPKDETQAAPVRKVSEMRSERGKKINIAVTDLRAVSVAEAESTTVSEFMRTALVNTGIFRMVDRANMEKILNEQKFQQTGCTTEECAVQMGKILNVQKIVTGSISLLGGVYYIQASVMDIEKGEIEVSQSVEAAAIRDLKPMTEQLARRIEQAYR